MILYLPWYQICEIRSLEFFLLRCSMNKWIDMIEIIMKDYMFTFEWLEDCKHCSYKALMLSVINKTVFQNKFIKNTQFYVLFQNSPCHL